MKLRENPDIWAVALLCAVLGAGPGLIEKASAARAPRVLLAIETDARAGRAALRDGMEWLMRLGANFRLPGLGGGIDAWPR
jgi:hypothetical protein